MHRDAVSDEMLGISTSPPESEQSLGGGGADSSWIGCPRSLGSGQKMEIKRMSIRRLAERRPGALTRRGLEMMHTQLNTEGEEVSDEGVWTPVCQRYYLSILLPLLQATNSKEEKRELRTLVTALDLGIRGRNAQCLDTLMQRVKSKTMALAGNAPEAAQYLELMIDKAILTSPEEEEICLQIHRQDLKHQRLKRD